MNSIVKDSACKTDTTAELESSNCCDIKIKNKQLIQQGTWGKKGIDSQSSFCSKARIAIPIYVG